ncbi:hypothetical protein Taro_005873 [Colocasia esculenta]|uniref:Aminotransferase-like plant mobile domain-containing protein n=1 Tax=Colocasia esculenta TaxID=4460 RepID=A0A843TR22_COLES|nr:hypothetical protein [Colocasia esculenta]
MEGGRESGEGSSRRKRHTDRWSSYRRAETVREEEEEMEDVVMELETVPEVLVETDSCTEPLEGKCRARCPEKRGSDKRGSGPSGPENAVLRPAAIPDVAAASNAATLSRQDDASRYDRDLLGRCDMIASHRAAATRDRLEEMGFGEVLHMERMRTDPALTQALRSRWDTDAMAFVFLWGHMIPSLEDVSRITGLRVYGRPTGDDVDEYLEQLVQRSRRELAREPGAQADLELRRFLILFLGRLLFATRGDAVHCHFLPLLNDRLAVGGFAWGAAFLAHQVDSLGASDRQTSTSRFNPFFQVWAYLHLPGLGRGVLERPGLVPIARRWNSPWDSRNLEDQLTRLQELIDGYPYLGVVWQAYLEEGDGAQPCVHFGCGRVPWSTRFETGFSDLVDVSGEIASLRALLHSAVQDREAAQRQTSGLRSELERVRGAGAGGASSSRSAGGSPSLLEARQTGAVLRAEQAQRHLEEWSERDRFREEAQTTRSERDQLRIRAEEAEAQVAEMTREVATLRVQRPPRDKEEVTWLRAELLAQQTLARGLQQIVTDIGRSRSRSRSGVSVSRATGASVGQYLVVSSSMRRNEEEERHRQGEGSAYDGRGDGEMLPPPDRREGSGESGGGQ